MPIFNISQKVTASWNNLASGADKSVTWCGRQLTASGKAISTGTQKTVDLAMEFFRQIALKSSSAANNVAKFVKEGSAKAASAVSRIVLLVKSCFQKQKINESYATAAPLINPNLPLHVADRAQEPVVAAQQVAPSVREQAEGKEEVADRIVVGQVLSASTERPSAKRSARSEARDLIRDKKASQERAQTPSPQKLQFQLKPRRSSLEGSSTDTSRRSPASQSPAGKYSKK